jgi:hypothetical protein
MPVDDLPFHHFLAVVRAREGAPPDTLPVLEQAVFVFSGGGWISPLFSESRRTVPAAGGFWYTTAEPGLARYDEQGALTRIVRCDVGDRSVTADEVELEIQGRTEGRPEAEARRIREEVSTRARVERFPAMDRAIEGADGGIWVREYLRPSQRGRTPRWLAFDGDGRLQAWVELPAEWDLRLVEADAVWVVVSDELDVQHLQRHVRGPG